MGSSATTAATLQQAALCARSSARVLIVGESGTGKELLAHHIHAISARARGPFVAVNCAGVTETLLESELFGHVRGAFTGAHRDKRGTFELADRGTLFLDEVGEMSLRMQGLLLRVLETGEIQKVGSDAPTTRTNVRLVAATNRDLEAMVASGAFRSDLYYRLNVLLLRVPPLRERRGDVRELADVFLARAARDIGGPLRFGPGVYAMLEAYDWPGNIRQLENAICRAVVHCTGGVITPADFMLAASRATPAAGAATTPADDSRSVGEQLYAYMRESGASFWDVVRTPYLSHDLTRRDVSEVIRLALTDANGQYTVVAGLLNLPPSDYKRLLNFLRGHDCLPDYRPFRNTQSGAP